VDPSTNVESVQRKLKEGGHIMVWVLIIWSDLFDLSERTGILIKYKFFGNRMGF
jgi:hypothetical protein